MVDMVDHLLAWDPCHGEEVGTGKDGTQYTALVTDMVDMGAIGQFDAPNVTVDEVDLHREFWVTQKVIKSQLLDCSEKDRWLVGVLRLTGRAYTLSDVSDEQYENVVKILGEIDAARLG